MRAALPPQVVRQPEQKQYEGWRHGQPVGQSAHQAVNGIRIVSNQELVKDDIQVPPSYGDCDCDQLSVRKHLSVRTVGGRPHDTLQPLYLASVRRSPPSPNNTEQLFIVLGGG